MLCLVFKVQYVLQKWVSYCVCASPLWCVTGNWMVCVCGRESVHACEAWGVLSVSSPQPLFGEFLCSQPKATWFTALHQVHSDWPYINSVGEKCWKKIESFFFFNPDIPVRLTSYNWKKFNFITRWSRSLCNESHAAATRLQMKISSA